jgi:hypothetical protein
VHAVVQPVAPGTYLGQDRGRLNGAHRPGRFCAAPAGAAGSN